MNFKYKTLFLTLFLIIASTTFVKANIDFSIKTDLNKDGVVNNLDIDILSTYYNKTNDEYDFNNDGIIDIYDMTFLSKDINTELFRVYTNDILTNEFKNKDKAIDFAKLSTNSKIIDSSGNIIWTSITTTKTYKHYSYSLNHMLDLQMNVSPQTDLVTNFFHNATPEQASYYINPNNFLDDTYIFQFLKLSTPAGISENDLNTILQGKGILEGKGSSYIAAAQQYNINEIYLLSHSLLETGNGSNILATGVMYNGRKVYNMYSIGAIDSDPINNGAKTAYENGWFTPEIAIEDGAKFIGNYYIHAGQDTLYKMRWNPENPATHQYATDIGWAAKQTIRIKNYYDSCKSYTIYFDIPTFE